MSATQRFQADIWQKAKEAAECISACWCSECVNRVARQVAQLVQDERERCINIARNYPSGKECEVHSEPSAAANAAMNIADLISYSSAAPNLPADDKGRSAEECADRPTEQGGGDD